jgi:hypothetical protein
LIKVENIVKNQLGDKHLIAQQTADFEAAENRMITIANQALMTDFNETNPKEFLARVKSLFSPPTSLSPSSQSSVQSRI